MADNQVPTWDNSVDLGDKYGTTGQQILTGIEGASAGFAGPIATGVESALSHAGVPGLTPEDQAQRAEYNPVVRHATEIGGFGAGALTGMGEAAALSKVGEAAASASKIGNATVTSRLATQGIKTGAEIAALQSGNEVSKVINQDPNQTLGTAAINIGLAGLLGGAVGVPLGGVSELWMKGLDATDTLINDVKARVAYRQALEANEIEPLAKSASQGIESKGLDPFTGESYNRVGQTARSATLDREHIYDPFTKSIVEKSPGETIVSHGEDSFGAKIGDWMFDKGREALTDKAMKGLGGTVGALGGALAGHPLFGAYIGEKTLTPILSTVAKPLIENLTDGVSMKAAVDYLAKAVKGAQALDTGVRSIFTGSEVLAKNLLPTEEQRLKLKDSLQALNSPDHAVQIGSGLNHYLPGHSVAAGALVGTLKTYFDQLMPKATGSTPFNKPPPISKSQQAGFDRQLDIAQQPLMVLRHVQNGTLTAQDVKTLNQVYPGLQKTMSDKITEQMVDHHAKGKLLPYSQRIAVQLLMGSSALDGSLTPPHMQAIMSAQGSQQVQNQSRGGHHKASATNGALKAAEKVSSLYANPADKSAS